MFGNTKPALSVCRRHRNAMKNLPYFANVNVRLPRNAANAIDQKVAELDNLYFIVSSELRITGRITD